MHFQRKSGGEGVGAVSLQSSNIIEKFINLNVFLNISYAKNW